MTFDDNLFKFSPFASISATAYSIHITHNSAHMIELICKAINAIQMR